MKVIDVEEVAARLGISHWTARDWIKHGRINGFKLGVRWVVPEEALEEFIARCRKANDSGRTG